MVFLTISPPLLFRPTTRTAPWQENPPWTWLACTLTTARANKTTSTSGIPYPVIYVHLGWDHVFPCISFLHGARVVRSEEHTSELQSLMRISYAVFCLKKKNKKQ